MDRPKEPSENLNQVALREMTVEKALEDADRRSPWLYEHEESYAVRALVPLMKDREEAFKRGFEEGWKALRSHLLRDSSRRE